MGHDASKVLMGTTRSSDRDVTPESGDPSVILAGRACVRDSNGDLSLDGTDGELIGVSAGPSLSDEGKKVAVVRSGLRVPMEVAKYLIKGNLTLISKVRAPLTIAFTDTVSASAEAGTATVNEDGSIDLVLAIEGGTSTATQCKTALDSDLGDYLETQIESGEGSTAQAAFAEDDIDLVDHAVIGAAVLVSAETGMAIPSGGTATNAVYSSGNLTGVVPNNDLLIAPTEIDACLVDMAGGL